MLEDREIRWSMVGAHPPFIVAERHVQQLTIQMTRATSFDRLMVRKSLFSGLKFQDRLSKQTIIHQIFA